MNIIGDVDGRPCILIDDIVDSAGTLCNAAAALKEQGATEVVAYCTHGVLSGAAAARVDKSVLNELVITDSICRREAGRSERQDPPPDHRAADRRGDPPHRRRSVGLQPVRLIRGSAGRTRASGPDPRADSRSAAAPGTSAGPRPAALRRISSIAAALPSRSPTRWFIWAKAMVSRSVMRAI